MTRGTVDVPNKRRLYCSALDRRETNNSFCMFAQTARSLGIFRKWKRRKNPILIYEYSMEGVAANGQQMDPANVTQIDPANGPQMDPQMGPQMDEDPPPPPPTLIRQNAQVMGTAMIDGNQYPIQDYQGNEFVTINGATYNLMNDANGRYVVMNGVNTPAQGGRRRRSRRTKRSRKSRRTRRV